jgi:hypothetical protein
MPGRFDIDEYLPWTRPQLIVHRLHDELFRPVGCTDGNVPHKTTLSNRS